MASTTTTLQLNDAERNARGHVETIAAAFEVFQFCIEEEEGKYLGREAKALLRELGYDGTNRDDVKEANEERAREQALSVDVRTGWHSPHSPEDSPQAEEFQIMLSTGGPALRIVGNLSAWLDVQRLELQHQDWGTPWIKAQCNDYEQQALEWFASLFWFGEA